MELYSISFQLFRKLVVFLFFISPVFGAEPANRILYLMQSGETTQALQAYQDYSQHIGKHDFELLQQLALTLLDQGYRSNDPEVQLLTLFGAGISINERVLYILEEALSNNTPPQLQMIALNFIARYQNDRADEALNHLMGSNNLLIRFEAAFQLAAKKYPTAIGQIESLMAKVDPELLPVFPQLYAMVGDAASIKIMRKLLTHPNEAVRIETILNAARCERDDLLPSIRRLATHHEPAQQEACATALGMMKDESSVARLNKLSQSRTISVRLAAFQSLYELGRKEARRQVEEIAKTRDLFAINILGGMAGSENLLAQLVKDENIQVKVNAGLALLERKDPRCLEVLCDVLVEDARDLLLLKTSSIGGSLNAWRVVPSASQNFQDNPVAFELSLNLREEVLAKALELPEKDFLNLAHTIYEVQQNDLVPQLTSLLENLQTPNAIALLKRHQQKVGAPLVRNYCNLALYRLKQPGPYAANLSEWVTKQQSVDMIRFRPFVPWDLRENSGTEGFQLTPQETSRLLVEAFESFVNTQDDKGVDLLISLIKNGNQKNKYALVGLLMRATE